MLVFIVIVSFFGFPQFQQFENSPMGNLEQLMAFQRFDEVVQRADQMINNGGKGTNAKVFRIRANALLNIGRVEDCISDCNTILKMKANKEETKNAYYLRSNAYIQLGDPQKAERDAVQISDQGLIRKSRDLTEHFRKADEKIELGQFDQVAPILDTIISASPRAIKYKLVRANIAFNNGDFGKFLELTNEIQKDYPDDGNLHYKIGIAKMCENNLNDAQNIIRKTQRIKGSPKNCSTVLSVLDGIKREMSVVDAKLRAKIYVEVNESINKMDNFARRFCVETSNLLQFVYLQRCKLSRATSDPAIAVEFISPFVDKYPNSIDFVLERAEAYLEAEEYDSALFDFQTVHRKNPHEQRAVNGINKAAQLQKEASYVDYYQILGLQKGADIKQVKQSYMELVKKWHPDKYKTKESKKEAETKMKSINQAFDILGTADKKDLYDRGYDPDSGEMRDGSDFQGFNPFDIFNMFKQAGGFQQGFQQGGESQGGQKFQNGQGFQFNNGQGFHFEFHF